MTILKRDEFRATNTSNWAIACKTTSCEQFPKTVGTVGLLVTTSETFTRQTLLAMGARETLPVPGLVLVCNATTCNHLQKETTVTEPPQNNKSKPKPYTHFIAFNATCCEFLLVTLGTENLLFAWNKTLCTNWNLAHTATEAFLVPLSRLVFHFLRSCEKQTTKSTINKHTKLLIKLTN